MTRGGYNTRQKERVMEALKARGDELTTAEALWTILQAEGPAVGKTTVYRQLEQMAASGAARRVASEDGVARYQYVEDLSACQGHLHCQCLECGRLFHVDCDYLGDLDEHLLCEHGFGLDRARTVLMGVCAGCRKEEKDGASDPIPRDAGV